MEENKSSQEAQPTTGAPVAEPKVLGADSQRRFPTGGDIFAMLGIILGFQVVASLFLLLALSLGGHNPEAMDPYVKGRFMSISYLISMSLSLVAILYYRRVRRGEGGMRFSSKGLNPIMLLWAFVFMAASGVVCEPLFTLLPDPSQTEMGEGFWVFLMLVVFAPVLEELICRGVVLTSLRNRYGTTVAWLISALFFGVIHLQPVLVLNAFVIGLILGFIYIVTDSLWSVIILHALNNAVAYVMMVTGHRDAMLIDVVGSRTLYVVIYIVAVGVTVVSAYMVWRKLSSLGSEAKI